MARTWRVEDASKMHTLRREVAGQKMQIMVPWCDLLRGERALTERARKKYDPSAQLRRFKKLYRHEGKGAHQAVEWNRQWADHEFCEFPHAVVCELRYTHDSQHQARNRGVDVELRACSSCMVTGGRRKAECRSAPHSALSSHVI